ncbi:MAG: aldose 1-epimerase [Clostridia bacterium]|nr:aldose 1-epimerase [Clostridia bacterium]
MFEVHSGETRIEEFEEIVLKGEGHEVRILPQAGFNVYYWHYLDQEVLMKPVDIRQVGTKYGIPILFPTPNRMEEGTFEWKGKQYRMDKRGERVKIHGIVKDEPWMVTRLEAGEDEALCEACIRIAALDDLYQAFPFPCTLTVRYTLTAAGLHMDMKVRNDGIEEMPFGFAVHPYFSKQGDAGQVYLNVPVRRVYEADEALLPSGEIVEMDSSKRPDGEGHTVESLYLDNVFRGMTEDLESTVTWKSFRLHLRASDCYRNVVVFTPHNRPGFCIEPQTCSTNSINLYARGRIDESGLLILQPGAEFTSWVDYRIERLDG